MKYKKVAFLFPGQGAQAVGMGKDFYESFSEAKDLFQECESLLKRDLRKLIFEGPEDVLKETKHSQLAIYVVSLAMLAVLKKQFPDLKPYVTAGLSLGEYTALTASQRLGLSLCLPLVEFRGNAMHEACENTKGTMAAILGLTPQEIVKVAEKFPKLLWVANINSSEQTVISGTVEGVEKGIAYAKEIGAKRAIPLKVHGAFHSGLMKSAEEKLREKILALKFQESPIRFIMNVNGQYVEKSHDISDCLIRQVTGSVLWEKTINTMRPDCDLYIEIGPGRVLAGLNKQMNIESPTLSINKIQDLETLNQLLS